MVKDKIKAITDKTMIPLSFVVIIISGAIWITTLSNKTEANTNTIETYVKKLDKIIQDLGYIKGKLGIRDGE